MFAIWCEHSSLEQKNASVLKFILNTLNLNECQSDIKCGLVKQKVVNFNSFVSSRWKSCNRTRKVFENKYYDWLDESILFFENQPEPGSSKGRPHKSFIDLGEKRKKRKILPLLENYSTAELTFAARRSLESSGQRNASRVLKEVSENSPGRATKIRKALNTLPLKPIKYTPEEAVAFFIDARLTKKSYTLMQQGAKYRNANIYPNYNILLDAKKRCYPTEENIVITDISAEVNLQALVDHTAKRIVQSQDELLKNFSRSLTDRLTLMYKWGCDGSSGHSTYKQGFSSENDSSTTDFYLFSV